jgi:hypothetical protein
MQSLCSDAYIMESLHNWVPSHAAAHWYCESESTLFSTPNLNHLLSRSRLEDQRGQDFNFPFFFCYIRFLKFERV